MTVKAAMPVRFMNLVEPLGARMPGPTARRTTDTTARHTSAARSGAVTPLIGRASRLRPGDVDRSTLRSTRATTPGARTSSTATATPTTRTTSSVLVPSADSCPREGSMSGRKPWTPNDEALLRDLYPDHTASSLAVLLQRPEGAIYRKANALGLAKSAAFLESATSGRIRRGRTDPRMVASQIKPGATPWNKGIKGSTGLHDNCRRTQFKKGRPAAEARNYVPIGSHRISKDGYLEQKVTDDPGIYPARRWIAVHRLVWERENGPIPQGRIVVYRPGMKTTVLEEITVDRLDCITRAENAQRNHPRSKSPELAKLVQLKGAITRQVNRIAREAKEISR